MSTSLAEQLRRLAAPQTSILVDSTKRPSILFDPKEAANKDRKTIFEFGHNGLMELVALNPSFLKFEKTLFDLTAVAFERSVENKEVNRDLDKTIKRFFHHLSPYFMLQPAHMCIEWLIRRFHIEKFNKNEFLQLILPYHETKIFVRCVQVLRLKDANDGWEWLLPIQRSGVALSKNAVLNRAAVDPSFLKFVCKSTVDAVKELDSRAHTLQAQLAFYCTTVIGALEYAREVTEWHVSNILSSVLKGLSSTVLDFCAAAHMICAQIVFKTKLSQNFLDSLIAKVCKLGQPALQNDSVMLLVLIFETQAETLSVFPDASFSSLVTNDWIPATIGQLAGQGFVVSPFCVPVVSECLRRVQTKAENWLACKQFVEKLMNVHFNGNEAKHFIRCVLDSYHHRKSVPISNTEIIEIKSDDEDEIMLDSKTQSWYADFLEKLERQYPVEFDFTIKETMRGRRHVSESRKQALKIVLAFRQKSLCSEENSPINENLYHHNPRNRAEAVKFLVKNFSTLGIAQNDDLFKNSLLGRLSDDNPKVLTEVLKLSTATLIKALANEPEAIAATTENILMTAKDLPAVEDLLKAFKDSRDYVYLLLMLTASYKVETSSTIALEVLDTIVTIGDERWYTAGHAHDVPLNIFLKCLLVLADRTKLPERIKVLTIFKFLVTKSFTSRFHEGKAEYTDALKNFLESIFPSAEEKLNFLANFFVMEPFVGVEVDPELRIRSIRLFCSVASSKKLREKLDRLSFVKILISLSSKIDLVRECALKTLGILCENQRLDSKFDSLARKILDRHEEILLDQEQFALVLFTLLMPNKSEKKEPSVLDDLIAVVLNPGVENLLKAETLGVLKHINNLTVFKRIIKAGLDILEHIEATEDDNVLDKARSDIIKFVVARLDDATIKILNDDESAWNLISKLLMCHRITMHYENKLTSVAILVMDIFNEDLYKKLPEKHKVEFMQKIVEALTFADDNLLISSGQKLMKRICLDGTHIKPILTSMKESCTPAKLNSKAAKAIAPDPTILNCAAWKNGITLLELLQNKKKIENFVEIVPSLVELLQKCLEFEEQLNLEYVKQLILSCLLQCCQKVLAEGSGTVIPDTTFRIDLIVQCIRATQNPQTHHHALILLSQCASMFPQQVLHNIMDIFTFMGSSVVRHDDAFSFQIITKIIESIVPTLVSAETGISCSEKKVVPILRVFSDIVLDVPQHRRIPLYTKLIRTLGGKKYLWMFLCVLLESHVVHDEKEKPSPSVTGRFGNSSNEVPKRLEFSLQLLKEFNTETALKTCIALFGYLRTLPTEKGDEVEDMSIDGTETSLFDVDRHSSKLLRHFKYVLVQFISNFTSSPEFINRVAALNDEDTKAMKSHYQEFIIKILCYVPQVTAAVEQNAETNQIKYWKVMLHHCYDVLENAISLLSPDMLLVVVHGLMQHKLPTVRKKVIEILIAKLQYKTDYFSKCTKEYLVNLLQPLNEIVDTILDKKVTATQEVVFIQQIALIAIKLLSRLMATDHVDLFKDLLTKLTKILKKRDSIAKILIATVVLAITEICSNLKAHSISQLSKFMPHIIEALHDQSETLINQPPDNVVIAVVTSMQKIFETLPLFLGPYMVDILIALNTIWLRTTRYEEDARTTKLLVTKLAGIWTKIAETIPVRVIIPICDKTYRKLVDDKQYGEIKFLMKLLRECLEKVTGEEIQSQQAEISTFFLNALEFRSQLADHKQQNEIRDIEESILQSFVSLIFKLSESSFRPLYHKIYDWAIRESDEKDRAITYFLLSSRIAEALKSLFVLFAGDFVQDAADLLDKCNSFKTEDLYFPDSDEKNLLLVQNILTTLNHVFIHDSKGFINEHRFDILMQPVVDQLQNRLVLENESLKTLLVSCVSQLAHVVRNDTLWKQLNYQILLKTRSNNPEVRIISLSCSVAVARKLGELFVPLLPETIPFVAELLEDENERVEKACRREVAELENVTGVSINQFF